jgi:NhaP-type Na+/H+ or K+/H+ antiporter
MFDLNLALVVVSGVVLVLGLFSNYIRDRTWISEPMLAMLLGVMAGPFLLDLLPFYWSRYDSLLEVVARLTLAIGLMAVALRLPDRYTVRHWRSLAVLICILMPLMWLMTAAILIVFLGLDWKLALLAGAVVTPTDPIVASSIITGKAAEKYLPARLRNLLSTESAANDGLAYPIVLLSYYLLAPPKDPIWIHWLTHTLLWEVGVTVVFGILLGYSAGTLVIWAERKHLTDKTSFLAFTLTLSLLTLGLTKLFGTDGILAVFAAGLAFNRQVKGKERAEDANVQEAIGQFFVLLAFTFFGLMLPWQDWLKLGWPIWLSVICILLFRRLPPLLLLKKWIPELKANKDVLFLGWFGPVGISAVFYALFIWHLTGFREVWVIASLIIFVSVIVHGTTASPFTHHYRQMSGRNQEENNLVHYARNLG